MDLKSITASLENCPCGREHKSDIKAVETGRGLVHNTGEILDRYSFSKKILLVADKNTMKASEGILESLDKSGYLYMTRIYEDMRTADMREVNEIESLSEGSGGILSVGSGSLNDICRLASYRAGKAFAIFATAPSMDGFASGTSPITTDNFKETWQARQPDVIIADTSILAKAPAELKAAGFGDIIAKYIALADWKISSLTTGEHYCPKIAGLVEEALRRISALAGRVSKDDEEAAEAIMEVLVFTGIAMKLEDSVRPASGTEHVLSHYWEIKKLEKGLPSDFHGKKTGVATLIVNRIYKEIASYETVDVREEQPDWQKIYDVYGRNFEAEVRKANDPPVTTETDPAIVVSCWGEIRRIINEELPSDEHLLKLMKLAGAAITLRDISVEPELGLEGIEYHPYMRHRMTLMRLMPMLGIDIAYEKHIRI